METICTPFVGATKNMHLGTLYTGFLIDSYKRSLELAGKKVSARETWNCCSQKLETKMLERGVPKTRLREECLSETQKSMRDCQEVFYAHGIELDNPVLLDASEEYEQFVKDYYAKALEEGRIKDGEIEVIPFNENVVQFREGLWYPSFSLNRIKGAQSLKAMKKVSIFREGEWGIKNSPSDSHVFGQRFVQAILPQFYRQQGQEDLTLIAGNDVIAKWIYLSSAISPEGFPFKRVALSGMVLDKKGSKMSRYRPNSLDPEIKDAHPDAVRLSFVARPFGTDFKIPDFSVGEKVRRKVMSCVDYIKKFAEENEGGLTENELRTLTEASNGAILEKMSGFNFNEGYTQFRQFIFEEVSKKLIPSIREKGISKRGRVFLMQKLEGLENIFMPISLREGNEL